MEAIKLCRHCHMQYPAMRSRGCKCDGETDALLDCLDTEQSMHEALAAVADDDDDDDDD